jgi:hypothetical protein
MTLVIAICPILGSCLLLIEVSRMILIICDALILLCKFSVTRMHHVQALAEEAQVK